MESPKRTYRDTVFRSFFSDPKNFTPLAESLSGTAIPVDSVRLNTIEDVLFSNPRNDVSYSIGNECFILTEHQSTVNFNMPLRMLFYIGVLYRSAIPQDFLYRTARISVPAPRFYVFYNGTEARPERERLRLSDAFPIPSPCLEAVVDVYNINYSAENTLLQKCRPMHDYSYFNHCIRENKAAGMPLRDAIRAAMQHCIRHDIMREYLQSHEWEVFDMVSLVWNDEDAKTAYIRQGEEIGEARGEARGEENAILRNLRSVMNKFHESAEGAMDALDIPLEQRAKYRRILETRN